MNLIVPKTLMACFQLTQGRGRAGEVTRILSSVCLLLALVLFASPARAQAPQVDRFFPSGMKVDSERVIKVNGKLGPHPLEFWVDRPGLTIAKGSDENQLQFKAAADAKPGLYWIRCLNKEGASEPRPFILDVLDEVEEVEPNDLYESSQKLVGSGILSGKLEKRGDVDCFSIDLKSGERLVAAVEANNHLLSPMDSVIQVCNERGIVHEQNDDGLGLDSLIRYDATRDEKVIIRIFAFPEAPDASVNFAGGEAFSYRLTVTTGTWSRLLVGNREGEAKLSFGNHVPHGPTELFDLVDRGVVSFTLPQVAGFTEVASHFVDGLVREDQIAGELDCANRVCVAGRLANEKEVDIFTIRGLKDQAVTMELVARRLRLPTDVRLVVRNAEGKILQDFDDSGESRDLKVNFKFPADGTYRFEVSDRTWKGGEEYGYLLSLSPVVPSLTLTGKSGNVVCKKGSEVVIELTPVKIDGFEKNIEIIGEQLPSGVELVPTTWDAKEGKSEPIKLTLKGTTAATSGPLKFRFREVGTQDVGLPIYFSLGGKGELKHPVFWFSATE